MGIYRQATAGFAGRVLASAGAAREAILATTPPEEGMFPPTVRGIDGWERRPRMGRLALYGTFRQAVVEAIGVELLVALSGTFRQATAEGGLEEKALELASTRLEPQAAVGMFLRTTLGNFSRLAALLGMFLVAVAPREAVPRAQLVGCVGSWRALGYLEAQDMGKWAAAKGSCLGP